LIVRSLIALSVMLLAALPVAAAPKMHTVTMDGMRYVPESLTVKKGDTVVWVNKDVVAHTATAPAFDSGLIAPGQSWKYTVRAKGEFPYVCTYHPRMKGSLTVK
jgi:plastocyanin